MDNTIEFIVLMEDTPETLISLFNIGELQFMGNPEQWVCLHCSQKLQYTPFVNINTKGSIASS